MYKLVNKYGNDVQIVGDETRKNHFLKLGYSEIKEEKPIEKKPLEVKKNVRKNKNTSESD